MTVPASNNRKVRILLIILPVWLVGSAAGALWYYFHLEKKQTQIEGERFVQSVSITLLADDLKKIVEVIGERNTSSEIASANLSRTASMIEGLLGPSNTGYLVKKTNGPTVWPILQTTIQGKNPKLPAVWVVTSYDSRGGSRGAEKNATGLAATLAAAQALAGDKPKASIHFIFLPHANDEKSPLATTASKFSDLIKTSQPPKAMLYVESMGAGELIWLNSRDINAMPLNHVAGLGKVYGTEIVDPISEQGMANLLFEMNLPVVRVATRAFVIAQEKDEQLPFAPTVAAATGRLIELIRRCANQ